MTATVCVLHEVNPSRPGVDAQMVVFGLSLCRACGRAVSHALAEGASVRELLRQAIRGSLP